MGVYESKFVAKLSINFEPTNLLGSDFQRLDNDFVVSILEIVYKFELFAAKKLK